jgi:hypothetical protein
MNMDDERLEVLNTLAALTRDVLGLVRSVEVLKAYLIVNSQDQELTTKLFAETERMLAEADPNQDKMEQSLAILDLLKVGKKSDNQDA